MSDAVFYLLILGPSIGAVFGLVAYHVVGASQQRRAAIPADEQKELTHWLEHAWYETPPWLIGLLLVGAGSLVGLAGLESEEAHRAAVLAQELAAPIDAVRQANAGLLRAVVRDERDAEPYRQRAAELDETLQALSEAIGARELKYADSLVVWLKEYRFQNQQAAGEERAIGYDEVAAAYELEAERVQALADRTRAGLVTFNRFLGKD